MSEMKEINIELKDRTALVSALKEMGYKVRESESAVELYNSFSSAKPKAHIIVSRDQIGGYGDVGFEIVSDKKIVMHADDMDVSKKFSMKNLKQLYAKNVIMGQIDYDANMHLESCEEEQDGTLVININYLG